MMPFQIPLSHFRDESPPYPYTLHNAIPLANLVTSPCDIQPNQEIREDNEKKIAATFKENKFKITSEAIALLCTVAERVESAFAVSIKAHECTGSTMIGPLDSVPNSLILVSTGSEKRLYISLKGQKIHDGRKISTTKKATKVIQCLLLTFDKDLRFNSLEEFVKISFPFLPRSNVQKRISIMQQLGDQSEVYPKTYDFILYKSKLREDKIALFQKRAFCDLLHFTNKIANLNTLPDRKRLCKELTTAIFMMHQQGFVHRDIKLDNILVDIKRIESCLVTCPKDFCKNHQRINLKVTDFEFACRADDEVDLRRHLGTPTWAAPEIHTNSEIPLDGKALDTWCLGHIFYIFATGQPHKIHACIHKRNKIEDEIRNFELHVLTLTKNEELKSELEAKIERLLAELKNNKTSPSSKNLPTKPILIKSLLIDSSKLQKILKPVIESREGLIQFLLERGETSAFIRRLIRTIDNCTPDWLVIDSQENLTQNNLQSDALTPQTISLEHDLTDLALANAPAPTNETEATTNKILKIARELYDLLQKTLSLNGTYLNLLHSKSHVLELLVDLLRNLAKISLKKEGILEVKTHLNEILQRKRAEKLIANQELEQAKQSLTVIPERIITITDVAQAMLLTDPSKRLTIQALMSLFELEIAADTSSTCVLI